MKILNGPGRGAPIVRRARFFRNEPVPGRLRSLSVSGEHELAASQEADLAQYVRLISAADKRDKEWAGGEVRWLRWQRANLPLTG
jgi:hypothetical protein